MYKDRNSLGEGKTGIRDAAKKKKRVEDPLERSSPAASKGGNAKEKDRLLMASTASASHRRRCSNTDNKNAFEKAKYPDDEVGEDSEINSEELDLSGSEGDGTSWISWFCSLRGNEFFCEVDEEYIRDAFNLSGLNSLVPYYEYALDLILDVESPNNDLMTEEQNGMMESAAEMLYGLIHVRYILTSKGLNAMLEKFKSVGFGTCPREYCSGQPCLPVGQSDICRSSTVKIYCPKCEELYHPASKYQGNVDGAYFGTTFPHLFVLTYPNIKPAKSAEGYIPRIFGFKIQKTAK